MRAYDRSEPLIFIHVPKAAGTSTRQVFDGWFGSGLLPHYYQEGLGQMPERHDIFARHRPEQPVLVYGHFNRARKFGIEDYYPEARQFISIWRDPFERLVSSYFYISKNGANWQDQSRVPQGDIEQYVLKNKSTMLNHFPRQVTRDNYRDQIEEFFIEIGLVEHLDQSMQRIAAKLGLPYAPNALLHLNGTERTEPITPHLLELFIDINQLEYEVYEYIKSK